MTFAGSFLFIEARKASCHFNVDTPGVVTYKRHMKTAQTLEFANWLSDLKDRKAKTKIAVRIARVEAGDLGDVK